MEKRTVSDYGEEAGEEMTEELSTAANPDDAEEWEDAEVEVKPRGTEVVSFRVPSQELTALIAAAKQAGESLSEYIRGAIAIRMFGTPIGPSVELNTSVGNLRIRSHIVVDSSKQNLSVAEWVPDHPPETVQMTGG